MNRKVVVVYCNAAPFERLALRLLVSLVFYCILFVLVAQWNVCNVYCTFIWINVSMEFDQERMRF